MTKPEIINTEALLSAAIDGLPLHFSNGWVSLEHADPDAGVWMGEQVAELEQQLIKAIQQRAIDAVTRNALVDLEIIGQAPEAQEQGK